MELSDNFNYDMSIELTILKDNDQMKKIIHLHEVDQEIEKLIEDLEEWFNNDEE